MTEVARLALELARRKLPPREPAPPPTPVKRVSLRKRLRGGK